VKELRSSCSRKDELIASYAKFVDEAKKLFDEKSALLESTYKEEIESLKKELDMYISLKEEMESFQWMKSDVLSSLKEDDLSWIPNEYKEMFIEWIEKTKYRMLESIAKITEKQAHIIYKNWAIVFANIILKDALWSLSYINNNIDAVSLSAPNCGVSVVIKRRIELDHYVYPTISIRLQKYIRYLLRLFILFSSGW